MYIIILYFACEKCIKSTMRSEVKYFFEATWLQQIEKI